MNINRYLYIFAENKQIIEKYFRDLESKIFDINSSFKYDFRKNNSSFVYDLSKIRGISDMDILLLYGWNHKEKTGKTNELLFLIQNKNCRVIGEKEYIDFDLWHKIQDIQNKELKIISRFRLLDI